MIKAMKDEDDAGNTNDDDDPNKEQFDLDAELQNRKKIKRKELDELTIMGTAMLMLVVGNLNQWFNHIIIVLQWSWTLVTESAERRI